MWTNPRAPGPFDEVSPHAPPDREVDVQAVVALVPLGGPEVRQRLAAQVGQQGAEEAADVRAQLLRVVTTGAAVGQRS